MNDLNKEAEILKLMRDTLIKVIKDTSTQPGLRHPLTQTTIEQIRHSLTLITVRQKELDESAGKTWDKRPTYPDTPPGETRVSITGLTSKTPKN